MGCMARFLSVNGRISAYFGNIHTTFSTHAYSEMCFHSVLSKCENSENIFNDVTTNELYCLEIRA